MSDGEKKGLCWDQIGKIVWHLSFFGQGTYNLTGWFYISVVRHVANNWQLDSNTVTIPTLSTCQGINLANYWARTNIKWFLTQLYFDNQCIAITLEQNKFCKLRTDKKGNHNVICNWLHSITLFSEIIIDYINKNNLIIIHNRLASV